MNPDATYELLRRVVIDESFRQSFFTNPESVFRELGIVDTQQVAFLTNVIQTTLAAKGGNVPLEGYQLNEMKEHYKVLGDLRKGISRTLEQMLRGFQTTMVMYTISFYLGIALIVSAVVFAFVNPESSNSSLLSIVFAGLGTADIIGYFIANPPLKLQDSRADLAQLQATYYAWYQDLRFWMEYLTAEYWMQYQPGLHSGDPETAAKASVLYRQAQEHVSSMIMTNTKQTVSIIERYVESKKRARGKADSPQDNSGE